MKLQCPRHETLSALQLVSSAVPGRNQRPILQNVKAIAGDDHCSLLATDLEVAIRRELENIPVDKPGEILFPAVRILAIFREAPDEELVIQSEGQKTTVRGQATEFELESEDPATFPDIPSSNGDGYHEITARTLKAMLRRTSFAAAAESPRYAMTGTLWELEGNKIRLVATDGRRLAMAEGEAVVHGNHSTKSTTHVVPTKAGRLLEQNLDDPEDLVRVTIRPNEAFFTTGQATIYTRLVEGRYPAYKDVFPKKSVIKVPLVTGAFHAAIRQAAVMAENESRRVVCSFGPKKLVLRSQSAEAGRSQVDLPIEHSGKTVEIAFDPRLLTDMLRVLDPADEVAIELTDGDSPALFRAGNDYSYLVMPLY